MQSPYRTDKTVHTKSNLGHVFDIEALLSMTIGFTKSFRALNLLACVNKHLNKEIVGKTEARKHWILLTATMTAMPSKGFVPEEITMQLHKIKGRASFYNHVRTLICPWTSTPAACMNSRGRLLKDLPGAVYLLASGNRLIFQSHRALDWQLSAPIDWSENWEEEIVQEKFEDLEERQFLQAHNNSFEIEIQERLSNPLDMFRFTNLDAIGDQTKYIYYHVHGGVFAVIAHYCNRSDHPKESCNGVYFFAYNECKMLAHHTIHWSTSHNDNFIQSRPGKLWVMTEDWLLHYQCEPLTGDQDCAEEGSVRLSEKVEQIDPCLFMASQGDTKGVLDFLERDFKGVSINTQTIFNKRTILHYAARNGRTETVKALLEKCAEPFLTDFNNATPLQLAVRGLHHETVCALVQHYTRGGAEGPESERKLPRQVFTSTWQEFRDFHRLRQYIPLAAAEAREQCRVAIPSILQSLWLNKHESAFSGMSEHILVNALESKTILCSAEAVAFIFHCGGENIRQRYLYQGMYRELFGKYHAPEHEREAIKTMIMTIEEFQLDVNFSNGITKETHLIWAIRNGTCESVKTLVEDLHADLSCRSNTGNGILAEANFRKFVSGNSTESVKIYDFIFSLVRCDRSEALATENPGTALWKPPPRE